MNEPSPRSEIEAQFITSRENNQYMTKTIPMWAGTYLSEIEVLLGPRDSSYCFLGVDFHGPDLPPRTWFPFTGIPIGDHEGRSRHIIIHLTLNASKNFERARWQLAHECVHLVDPWDRQVEGKYTNVLEEGLASWYQCDKVQGFCHNKDNYREALRLVRKYQDRIAVAVKNIRSNELNTSGKHMRIGDITPEVLMRYCSQMDEDDAVELCKRFVPN